MKYNGYVYGGIEKEILNKVELIEIINKIDIKEEFKKRVQTEYGGIQTTSNTYGVTYSLDIDVRDGEISVRRNIPNHTDNDIGFYVTLFSIGAVYDIPDDHLLGDYDSVIVKSEKAKELIDLLSALDIPFEKRFEIVNQTVRIDYTDIIDYVSIEDWFDKFYSVFSDEPDMTYDYCVDTVIWWYIDKKEIEEYEKELEIIYSQSALRRTK